MTIENKYIIKDREQSSVGEAFRALRSNILSLRAGAELKTLLFASASAGDGNARVAANLAATLAYTGKKVILVDCDLRNPVLQNFFNLPNIGITNMMHQELLIEEVLQDSEIPTLKILTSGPIPEKPFEVLSSPKMRDIIEKLKNSADYVLINSSPLTVVSNVIVTDACVLASKVDGVVLVIDSMTVRVKTAQKVLALIKGARGNILGTVLNNVKDDQEFLY